MDFVEEIFIEKNKISERVKELGQEITRDYKNKNLFPYRRLSISSPYCFVGPVYQEKLTANL